MARTKNDTRLSRPDSIRIAGEIIDEYVREHSMKMTLRQLFYQFVARGLIENSFKEYKRLKDTMSAARWQGKLDLDCLEDRGRSFTNGESTERNLDLDHGLKQAARYMRSIPNWAVDFGRWLGQDVVVSVAFEKAALMPVFEGVCKLSGVSCFAFRGYPSIASLKDWFDGVVKAVEPIEFTGGNGMNKHRGGMVDVGLDVLGRLAADDYFDHDRCDDCDGAGCDACDWETTREHDVDALIDADHMPRKAVLLYAGDFDPEGVHIPQAVEEAVGKLMHLTGNFFEFECRRLALDLSHVKKFNLPPMAVKKKSARFDGYVDAFGDDVIRTMNGERTVVGWELDGFPPDKLSALIADEIETYFDSTLHGAYAPIRDALRARMIERMCAPGWIESVFGW